MGRQTETGWWSTFSGSLAVDCDGNLGLGLMKFTYFSMAAVEMCESLGDGAILPDPAD